MTEVASAYVTLLPSTKGFAKGIDGQISGDINRSGQNAGKGFASGMRSSVAGAAKGVFAPLAAVGAGVAVVGLLKDSISAASDLAESTNKVTQVFGEADKEIFKFGETAAKTLGQTNIQARDAAATFGIFGKSAGLQGPKLAKFATGLTTLASDMASFSNTSPEEAIDAIGSALRGEAEPIRKYGVLLDEAALKAEALSLGLLKPVKNQSKIKATQVKIIEGQRKYNDAVKSYGKDSLEALKAEANLGTARDQLKKATEGTIGPLTQQQKVLAAQSAIMKQTADQQGDFARTSGGLANQQRILKARFEDAKAELGKGLLPIATEVVSFLNDKGLPAFENFAGFFRSDVIPAAKDVAGVVGDIGKAFDSLPGDVKKILLIGAGVGAAGLKAKSLVSGLGGKGGILAGLGKRALSQGSTPANPVNVFVVNNGLGLGGELGKKGKKGKIPVTPAAGLTAAALLSLGGDSVQGTKKVDPTKKIDFKGDQAERIESALGQLAAGLKVDTSSGFLGLSRSFEELDANLSKLAKTDPAQALKLVTTAAENAGVSVGKLARTELPSTGDALMLLGDASVDMKNKILPFFSEATTKADGLDRKLRGIAGQHVNPKVDLDTSSADAKLTAFKLRLAGLAALTAQASIAASALKGNVPVTAPRETKITINNPRPEPASNLPRALADHAYLLGGG